MEKLDNVENVGTNPTVFIFKCPFCKNVIDNVTDKIPKLLRPKNKSFFTCNNCKCTVTIDNANLETVKSIIQMGGNPE